MKKSLLFFIFSLFLMAGISSATVIKSDNFDSWSDWHSMQDPLNGWDGGNITGSVENITLDGATHSSFEVTATGYGGTGKGVRAWRNNAAFTGNDQYKSLYLYAPGVSTQVVWMRWRMKVPTAFSFAGVEDQKMFRLNTSDDSEIYFYFEGGEIMVCPNNTGTDCKQGALAPKTTWHDGNWHTHQVGVDLSTGTISWFVDGVQSFSKANMNSMPSHSATFGSGGAFLQHFPLGNTYTTDRYQSGSWQALEIDDFIIATTKAETDLVATDTTPPARSAGAPTGALAAGTTQTTMALTTDENATCKYSSSAGTVYASMTSTFSTTGGTSHSVTISGLADGGSYAWYARCSDGTNANADDYTISWSVSAAAAGTQIAAGTTVIGIGSTGVSVQ